jgi:hypothetical protein
MRYLRIFWYSSCFPFQGEGQYHGLLFLISIPKYFGGMYVFYDVWLDEHAKCYSLEQNRDNFQIFKLHMDLMYILCCIMQCI